MPESKSIAEYLNGIPAKRWCIIALRTEFTEDEILDSPALTLAICANEKHRAEHGRDDYPRFLDMGIGDLTEYLGEGALPAVADDTDDQAEDDAEGAPFPDSGTEGGPRVAADAGTYLPADADFSD